MKIKEQLQLTITEKEIKEIEEFFKNVLALDNNFNSELVQISDNSITCFNLTSKTLENESYKEKFYNFIRYNINSNLYFTPTCFKNANYSNYRTFIKEKDVIAYKTKVVFLDIDNLNQESEKIDILILLANKLKEKGIKLNYAIDSGNGLHLYFILDTVVNNENLQEDFIKASKELFREEEEKELFKIDTKVKNLTRLMRIPLSYNTKNKKNVLKTDIIVNDSKASSFNKIAKIRDFISKSVITLEDKENAFKCEFKANKAQLKLVKNYKSNISFKKQGLSINYNILYENIKQLGIEKGFKNNIIIFLVYYLKNKNIDYKTIEKEIMNIIINNKIYECDLSDVKHTIENAYKDKVNLTKEEVQKLAKKYNAYSNSKKKDKEIIDSNKVAIKDNFLSYSDNVIQVYLNMLVDNKKTCNIKYIEKICNISNRQAYNVKNNLEKSDLFNKNENRFTLNKKALKFILEKKQISTFAKKVLLYFIQVGKNENDIITFNFNITSLSDKLKIDKKKIRQAIKDLQENNLIYIDKIKIKYNITIDLKMLENHFLKIAK